MNAARNRNWPLYALLLAALLVVVPLALLTGRTSGGPAFGLGSPELASAIFLDIRLPRVLLGLLVGGTLGVCGAALQGLLRNPLAEPGLLGASSGAALGAVLGALAALATLYALAGRRGDLLGVILAGIALNALAAALTSLALNFAPSPYAALEILFWMLGSLTDRSLVHVMLAAPLMLPAWIMLGAAARGLDALTLGEDVAQSLGYNPRTTQWLVIGGTALAIGAAVAVTGVVGFVGLVVPHVLRRAVGFHPSRLLVPSFLGGAVLTVAADLVIRLMPPGPELKLGVVTALLGAPFFLHLVLRARRAGVA